MLHKHCILDIETTGLPPKNANWETDFLQFPHIVQLSWKLAEDSEVNDYIIKPDGYEIPEEVSKIHGITTEIAIGKGVPFGTIIQRLIDDCAESELIIGHNLYFDVSIVKANILRLAYNNQGNDLLADLSERSIAALHKDKRVDTMSYPVIRFCAIPFPNAKPGSRNYKYPKLIELYFNLFGEEFPAHDSKYDVLATEKCYFELLRLGILQPKEIISEETSGDNKEKL